jgi:hypothetical protein
MVVIGKTCYLGFPTKMDGHFATITHKSNRYMIKLFSDPAGWWTGEFGPAGSLYLYP